MRGCEQCGEDISSRHYHARFCFPCSSMRGRASSEKWAKTSRKAARHRAVGKLTRYAIRVGVLQDPSEMKCSDCGKDAQCYDHRDYNKPLEVEPVCRQCNSVRGAGIPMSTELFTGEMVSAED